MAAGGYFIRDAKPGGCRPAAENSCRTPLPDRVWPRQIAAREGRVRGLLTSEE
jgi:hypothetical protein